MRVDLHLLEPEPAEGPQPDALEQRLERDLDDAGQNGDAGKFDRRKNLDLFVEHLLDVGGQAGVELRRRGQRPTRRPPAEVGPRMGGPGSSGRV